MQQQLNEQAQQIRDLQELLKNLTESESRSFEGSQRTEFVTDSELPVIRDDQPHTSELLFGVFPISDDASCSPGSLVRMPLVTEQPLSDECGNSKEQKQFHKLNYYADYDKGFLIRPFDAKKHPFELKVNGWIQARHHSFVRNETEWTDNAGVSRGIENRNAFDIERARLLFSGYALDPRLTYFLHLDGDTDGGHDVDFFDYWWGWQLTETFKLQVGKRKVPASRQWLLTARSTRFIERPMANDFFRPDRTVGVFGVGTVGETGHYELMLGNGYQTANLANSATDDRFTFAMTNYFDPLGAYGSQIVDFEQSREPLVRIGHSFVYSPQDDDAIIGTLPEADFLRLSDGTRLTQLGALAPGAIVSQYDIAFYGVDAAYKWRGWSVNSEVFLRWIDNIAANVPLPADSLEQVGFYVEGGTFLIPRKLDLNARCSQVAGDYGTASEYATGFNWYPLGKTQLKISFDVTWLDGSPLQNTTSDILAGDDGTLLRTQFQAEF